MATYKITMTVIVDRGENPLNVKNQSDCRIRYHAAMKKKKVAWQKLVSSKLSTGLEYFLKKSRYIFL